MLRLAWPTAAIVIAVMILSARGDAPPVPAAADHWEYGVYEVRTYAEHPTRYRWIERGVDERAEGEKFRLFTKLGAQRQLRNYHDLVLWNHLGTQGWEYVEQFIQQDGSWTLTQTIFRRPTSPSSHREGR